MNADGSQSKLSQLSMRSRTTHADESSRDGILFTTNVLRGWTMGIFGSKKRKTVKVRVISQNNPHHWAISGDIHEVVELGNIYILAEDLGITEGAKRVLSKKICEKI